MIPDLDVQVTLRKGRTASTGPVFRRGDADGNGRVQLADAVATLNALFVGGVALPCEDAADTSDNGEVNIVDAVMILDILFVGNAVVPAPGIDQCGADPTKDALGCDVYEACD